MVMYGRRRRRCHGNGEGQRGAGTARGRQVTLPGNGSGRGDPPRGAAPGGARGPRAAAAGQDGGGRPRAGPYAAGHGHGRAAAPSPPGSGGTGPAVSGRDPLGRGGERRPEAAVRAGRGGAARSGAVLPEAWVCHRRQWCVPGTALRRRVLAGAGGGGCPGARRSCVLCRATRGPNISINLSGQAPFSVLSLSSSAAEENTVLLLQRRRASAVT